MRAVQLYEIVSAQVFKMATILSFCKGVLLLYEMEGVQLFQLVAVLLLDMWVLLLYEIRSCMCCM